jgi:carbamoyl-phosphate synthase large subunit
MSQRSSTTVLVTGVGDTVGQALIKAARQSALPCRVLGTDRHEYSVGLRWVDQGFLLPHCADAGAYLDGMRKLCLGQRVDLILPGSEKELLLLAEHAGSLRAATGAIVVASSPEILRVALDKWETCRFLETNGLNFPRYARATATAEMEQLIAAAGFPLLAKPIRGTGAIGVMKIRARRELEAVYACAQPMVVQEYLLPDEEEYSVEVYTLKTGEQAGGICYRRGQLIAGDTYKAHVTPNEAVLAEARAVVRALKPAGPCNVQLRMTARGPVTFEINPRFSGGVAMRAHFGFNEVEMAIRDLLRDEAVATPATRTGMALRFWEEMYFEDKPEVAAVP